MNWIRKLLSKPAKTPSVAPTPVATVKPAEDFDRLRGALAKADKTERTELAVSLGHALAERSRAPIPADPPETWVAAICHAPNPALALAWSAELTGDNWLGEVAIRARGGEIRIAAARRIESTETLEEVAEASRDKDKRVYRHCVDLLKQRRKAELSKRRAQAMTEELQALLATAPLPATHLLDLKKELETLTDAAEVGSACQALLDQAFGRLREEAEQRRELQVRQQAAAALLAECSAAVWPWGQQLAAWREQHAALAQAEIPAWLADQAGVRALHESLAAGAARLEILAAEVDKYAACDAFLAPLEAGQEAPEDCIASWDALPRPTAAEACATLETRWQALGIQHPAPVVSTPAPDPVPDPTPDATPKPVRAPRPRVDQAVLGGLLDQMQQAIDEGHLVAADGLAKQIKGLPGSDHLPGALESRLHGLHLELEKLRGWARWGTTQARDKLIEAAQALLVGEHAVEDLAEAVPRLREEWKRLNVHGAAGKGQWESFDAALEQAYLPVVAFRAEQGARQAEAAAAKAALCSEWETELAGIGEQTDFKALEARRAEILKQWRAAPQASFREERGLRKRLDALIANIDQHLDGARDREMQRREAIIRAAEALSDLPEPRRAMAEARALQQRWSQEGHPVRLKRSDEQALWQRFRAASDAVFSRLDAQRAEQAAQRQQQAVARQALLDGFAASLEGADANAITRALSQFRGDWEQTRPNPRDGADSLENRARELQQQAQRRLDALRQEKHRERFALLARKAALIERIEAAAVAGRPLEGVMAEARAAWDALPPLPGKSENPLTRRLAAAAEVTQEQLNAGREARESLLLDLEIALALPSPEDFAQVRRERQLERLQGRFGGVTAKEAEPEAQLLTCYSTAALTDAAMQQRIAAVVEKLVEQAATAGQ